jgi:hypothetical protein
MILEDWLVHAEVNDDYRVVIDEDSLDWRALAVDRLHDTLDVFADMLQPMADGRHIALMSTAYSIECRIGLYFTDVPYTPHSDIPRDARVRLARLLDRCVVVEPEENDLPQPVRIAGVDHPEPSWGLSHALSPVRDRPCDVMLDCAICIPTIGMDQR